MRSPRALVPSFALLALLALPGLAEEPWREPPARRVDVTRIDLDVTVDLKARSLTGTAAIALTAVSPVDHVLLDAVDLEVSEVTARRGDAAPVKVAFSHDGERLFVPCALERGQEAALTVRYRVRDPRDGLFFRGPSPDAPDVPWQVWTQGETDTNRRWFPSVDHPDERQAFSLTARVEPGLTVISNGTLREKKEEGGKVVWRFADDRPYVSYLVTLVVGTFDVVEEEWRGKRVAYYVPPGRKADIPRSFDQTRAMLDFYSEVTGQEYPWPKYEQVVVHEFTAGGMENTGATTLNERTLHDERAHLDYSSEGLVAHELAHQWFGDLITCRDWAHIWLNESFATYFDALWVEKSKGADEFTWEMLGNREGGLRSGNDRPIVDMRWPYPGSVFDGRAYPKGACVLHMLRRRLGDEGWWRGLRQYVKTCADRSVETSDLRRCLEEATGESLGRFFRDWLERPGHPKLEVACAHDPQRGLLTVTVRQTQEGEPYAFPAELELGWGERRATHTIDVREKEVRLVLPSPEPPTWCVFDPRGAVLLAEVEERKGRDLWVAQLRKGDALGRIRAARALGKDGSPPAVDALATALEQDAFWGVQAECAEALGGSDQEPARAALRKAAQAHPHPKVRRAAVEALGKGGQSPATAEVLAGILERGDASYYVEAEAVKSFARAAGAPKDLLLLQLGKPSHNEVIRIAALDALAQLEDPSLVPLFVEQLGARHPEWVRQAAARALAVARLPGASEEQRKTATLALRDFLQRESRRGRRAALEALESMAGRAREALGAVEACAAQDPQERIREHAQRVAERIRRGEEPSQELTRLRRELKELHDGKAELERRLEQLEAGSRPTAAGAGAGGTAPGVSPGGDESRNRE